MGKQLNILLVDEDEKFLNELQDLILSVSKTSKINIQKCHSGEQAISRTKRHFYDFLFIDIKLDNVNGNSATESISRHNRYIYIIAITMNVHIKDIKKLLEFGAKNYIVKKDINLQTLKYILSTTYL